MLLIGSVEPGAGGMAVLDSSSSSSWRASIGGSLCSSAGRCHSRRLCRGEPGQRPPGRRATGPGLAGLGGGVPCGTKRAREAQRVETAVISKEGAGSPAVGKVLASTSMGDAPRPGARPTTEWLWVMRARCRTAVTRR
jgi:hypothetical protein